jgi:hypothetical protein
MNKFIKALFAIVFLAGLASCLKDTNYDDNITGNNLSNVSKVIELAPLVNPPYHDQSQSFDLKNEEITVTFLTVRLAAAEPASEDITVTLDTSNTAALLTAFNDQYDQNVITFPSSIFSFVGGVPQVVIPKGERSATLEIITNTSNFDPSEAYGLGFSIASIDKPGYVASGNFGDYVSTIGAKNQYDGTYRDDFLNYHPSANTGYTGSTVNVELRTAGPVSNKMYWEGGYYNPAILGGGLTAFGSQEPLLTLDPATNKVTVTNAVATGPVYVNAKGYDNHYDPATKIYYLKFGYNYTATGDFNPAATREWTIKLTYKGPR